MCGISAFLAVQNRGEAAAGLQSRLRDDNHFCWERKLDCSIQSMRHRGPDAKGVWVSEDEIAGLGHVRLSTRDLSPAGNQPLHSDQKDDLHVVVNGELYYDQSLREDLAQAYNFTSNSDSEIVLALYLKFGESFVHHLRGEFSLVLYDGKLRQIIAVRDRFGVKPLHYSFADGNLLIATQCKGVIKLLDQTKSTRWDVRCLAQGGGHYGNRTLFEGIRKFPAGHILVVKHGQLSPLQFRPYFSISYPLNEGGNDGRPVDKLISQLRLLLLEAVSIRLESTDVPVGILLSGGVDSSAVAGIAAHLIDTRQSEAKVPPKSLPICFTIAFPDDNDLDESAVASRTAEHLGLPVQHITVSEQVLVDEFEEACWLGEALMWDLQHVAKKAMSRHITNQGLKVVLNGDGSDELFGGYPHFVADRLLADDQRRAKSLQKTTAFQREQVQQKSRAFTKWFGSEESTSSRHEYATASKLGLTSAFCNVAVSRHDDWLLPSVRNLGHPIDAVAETFTAEELANIKSYHPMHRSMLAWTRTILPNMVIAAISDGAEMAHSVESRPPFLDHKLAEFAYTLPVDLLVHLNGDEAPVEKWLFRQAVKPFITEEVFKNRKHAFAAPFKWKKGGLLYKKLSSLITRENVLELGFVDWAECHDILDRAFDGRDQLLFRQVIWLAQILSIGKQFQVERWESLDHKKYCTPVTRL